MERPFWDAEILTPILKTSLGISNINTDSITTNSDNSLSLVFREELYSFGLDSLVGLSVEPFRKHRTLEQLKLDSDSLVRTVTLGELARQMKASGDPMGDYILQSHGDTIFMATVTGITAGPFDVDISNFFRSAKIKTGTLSMSIENGLPFTINNFALELTNKVAGNLIVQHTFPTISKNGGTASTEQDLAGKTVEGTLTINIPNMDIAGGQAIIDTNDALITTLIVKDLTVEEATAIFPAQDVIDDAINTPLEDMGDITLTKARLKKGKIKLYAEGTAPDTVYFIYSVPGATKNGVPFQVADKMNPAPPGGVSTKYVEYDFSGYEIDLTGQNHDTVNAIFNHLTARLEYTGLEKTFSLDDYIDIDLTINEIEASYVEGYLGKDTLEIPADIADLSIFNDLKVSHLEFKEVKVNLEIENGLGIEGELDADYVSASNQTVTKTILNAASGNVARATQPPLMPVTTIIPVNGTNPSPTDLLNLLPDKIGFKGTVYINPNGNPAIMNDFAYDESRLKAFINIELPMNFIANKFELTDTATLNSDGFSSPVDAGKFMILVDNGFPLTASVKTIFLNEIGMPVDSLNSEELIEAATIDPTTGKVTDKKLTKLSFYIEKERIERILNSSNVIFTVTFSTHPTDTHVKIYSDYTIDFKLTGDFDYTVK